MEHNLNGRTKPTKRQLEYQDWEFGLFIHFGIRTFYEGHQDWDGQKMSAGAFKPIELDCNQWMETARLAGMKYAVLTAKHHDGFANWPSKYTDFSVASSPWKNGGGDVVKEFVDACRRNGLKLGLYYSPADASSASFKKRDKDYDDYFINQISELLTGYGEIDILWFDGCGSEGHSYDWGRIIGEIRRLQPNILIFNMGDPDFRWVGNEAGLAPLPCWNTVDSVPFSIQTEDRDILRNNEYVWLPAECDCRMRDRNWFYSDSDEHTVKSVNELMGLYYYSVGRGANLLLNIGPDRRGLLPDKDAKHLLDFGKEIHCRFGKAIAGLNECIREECQWTYQPKQHILLDHAVIKENLAEGENAVQFEISVMTVSSSMWITVYEGRNIGHKAICRFPPVKVKEIRLRILESHEQVQLDSLDFYYVGD